MDPIKMREAFGLPPDAPAAELEAAMAADPDLIKMSGGPEAAAAVAALYGAEPAPEPTRGPWLVLESGDVARAALDLLELWIMARPDSADFEMTKISAMEQLSRHTFHDVMRIASATAALAVQVLTTDRDRDRVAERLSLEITLLMESHK